MRVLVVEDDPNLRSLWSEVLETAGNEVRQVETETSALDELRSKPYDLVVLDLCMSGRNALGVATLATHQNPACRVVVISGSAEFSRSTLYSMSPAVTAALRKPVDIEDLLGVCESVARDLRAPRTSVLEESAVDSRP